MKLYYHPLSPNCTKIIAAAAIAGVTLDLQLVDLAAGQQRGADFLAVNPNGFVPVLEDGDFILWESDSILQYIAETADSSTLLPATAKGRADVARWQFWSASHWSPNLHTFLFENIFRGMLGLGDRNLQALAGAQAAFTRFAAVLAKHLEGRSWLVGDTPTLADLSVGANLIFWEAASVPLRDHPPVLDWYGRLASLPAWQDSLPDMLKQPAPACS